MVKRKRQGFPQRERLNRGKEGRNREPWDPISGTKNAVMNYGQGVGEGGAPIEVEGAQWPRF